MNDSLGNGSSLFNIPENLLIPANDNEILIVNNYFDLIKSQNN